MADVQVWVHPGDDYPYEVAATYYTSPIHGLREITVSEETLAEWDAAHDAYSLAQADIAALWRVGKEWRTPPAPRPPQAGKQVFRNGQWQAAD